MATIEGGDGNDSLVGTDDAYDEIYGLGGSDTLYGTRGDDHLFGGEGNDILYAGSDGGVLRGENGNDWLNGAQSSDDLFGGDGNDQLYGGDGFDIVAGGDGDDTVEASAGRDQLDGGLGQDILALSYLDLGEGVRFAFNSSGAAIRVRYGGTAVSFERVNLTGGNGQDSLYGGQGADTVRGWQGDDQLYGRGGADFLIGDNGRDLMNGGVGDDLLSGGGHNDTLIGGAGDDTLVGGRAFDVFSGDDLLEGGPGADSFAAGLGRTDISYAGSRQGVYVDLPGGFGFGGDAQGDRFDYNGSFNFRGRLIGSAYDDQLIGGQIQEGGSGNDRLVAIEGTSQMFGGAGVDAFLFRFVNGASMASLTIMDWDRAAGERIDVSGVDARAVPGEQAFRFVGTAAFTTRAGDLRYEIEGERTRVEFQMDADAEADVWFYVQGAVDLVAADFVL